LKNIKNEISSKLYSQVNNVGLCMVGVPKKVKKISKPLRAIELEILNLIEKKLTK